MSFVLRVRAAAGRLLPFFLGACACACAPKPARVAQPAPVMVQTGVGIRMIDYCLAQPTEVARVADRNGTLLLPASTVDRRKLPLGALSGFSYSTDAGDIFKLNGPNAGWYLFPDDDAFFDLNDDREGGGPSCARFGASIRAALKAVQKRLQVEVWQSCSLSDASPHRIANTQLGACEGSAEFYPNQVSYAEYRARPGKHASLVIASGSLEKHVVDYEQGSFAACNLLRASNDSLVASLAQFSGTAEQSGTVEVVGTGCLGWLAGDSVAADLGESELQQLIDAASPAFGAR